MHICLSMYVGDEYLYAMTCVSLTLWRPWDNFWELVIPSTKSDSNYTQVTRIDSYATIPTESFVFLIIAFFYITVFFFYLLYNTTIDFCCGLFWLLPISATQLEMLE